MKSKICFFHSGPVQRKLKDVLAHLRSEGVTSRDVHDFILNYLCRCYKDIKTNDGEISAMYKEHNLYVEWLKNLNEEEIVSNPKKLKSFLKIKNDLLNIYDVINVIESKQNDFSKFVKFLKCCLFELDTSSILNTFLGIKINKLGYNLNDEFNFIISLPIPQNQIGLFVGARGQHLKLIESKFKCKIKIITNELNNPNRLVDIKVWSNTYENFLKIKNDLLINFIKQGIGAPKLEFKIELETRFTLKNFLEIISKYEFANCVRLESNTLNDKRKRTVKIWTFKEEDAIEIKNKILNENNSFKEIIKEIIKETYTHDESYIDDLLDIKYANSKLYSRKSKK